MHAGLDRKEQDEVFEKAGDMYLAGGGAGGVATKGGYVIIAAGAGTNVDMQDGGDGGTGNGVPYPRKLRSPAGGDNLFLASILAIDPDTGRVVSRGQPGELCTRGYSVMQGYWNDPSSTRAAIDGDRWMHTGDLASMDEDGYIRIVGRMKDMIIRGGENIYPREIEEYLYTCLLYTSPSPRDRG